MEKRHKKQIEKYRGYLIKNTKFDEIWEELKNDTDLFSIDMTKDILSTSNEVERNERFYDLIQDCGPTAFGKLTNALSTSGQENIGDLLLKDTQLCTEIDAAKMNQFPHLPPLICQVNVQKGRKNSQWNDVKRKDARSTYYVKSHPRGYLLLVNMSFKNNPLEEERNGSEVDVRNLKQLFTQLNYKIIEKHDLTLEQMQDAVYEFSHMDELTDVDSVIVFVMSHGRNPSQRKPHEPPLKSPGRESVDIELEDNRFINSNDIVDEINGSTTIRENVPKLFFFNICRGGKSDMGPVNFSPTFSQYGQQDTSTQIDAQPFYCNTAGSDEDTFRQEQNPFRPTNLSLRLNDPEPVSNPTNINNTTNTINNNVGNSMNGHEVVPLSENKKLNDSPEEEKVCCCWIVAQNSLRRKGACVRLAIWLSKTFKCSMPSQVEDVPNYHQYEDKSLHTNGSISCYPGGEASRVGNDSPDSMGTVEIVWPTSEPGSFEVPVPEMIEVPPSISRTSSRSSPPIMDRLLSIMKRQPPIERTNHLTGDIFMAFSTIDGYNSKRHPERGSWFVSLIVQVFSECAKDTDLISMMEEVDIRLREMFDSKYGRQLYVKKTEGFSRKFYFNVDLDQSEPTTPT